MRLGPTTLSPKQMEMFSQALPDWSLHRLPLRRMDFENIRGQSRQKGSLNRKDRVTVGQAHLFPVEVVTGKVRAADAVVSEPTSLTPSSYTRCEISKARGPAFLCVIYSAQVGVSVLNPRLHQSTELLSAQEKLCRFGRCSYLYSGVVDDVTLAPAAIEEQHQSISLFPERQGGTFKTESMMAWNSRDTVSRTGRRHSRNL